MKTSSKINGFGNSVSFSFLQKQKFLSSNLVKSSPPRMPLRPNHKAAFELIKVLI